MRQILLFYFLIVFACNTVQVEAQTVYVTKTGKKYHRGTCQYLRLSKLSISLEDAKARGYTACSVCRPSSTASDSIEVVEKESSIQQGQNSDKSKFTAPQKSSASRQCSSLTKSGLRCKRMTSSSTGKCWQHE